MSGSGMYAIGDDDVRILASQLVLAHYVRVDTSVAAAMWVMRVK